MSEQTIQEKSTQIRQETQKYANTRGRVADVLDDINATKSNKDASGLSDEQKQAWKRALGIPNHIATVSEEYADYTEVYSSEEIDEKIRDLQNESEDITERIDNAKYFGTNLLNGTKEFSENMMTSALIPVSERYRGLKVISKRKSDQTETFSGSLDLFSQWIGKHITQGYITLSWYAKADGETDMRVWLLNEDIQHYEAKGNPNLPTGALTYASIKYTNGKRTEMLNSNLYDAIKVTNQWKRYSVSIRIDDPKMLLPMANNWRIGIRQNNIGVQTFICGVKLEYGFMATDWSPSVKDMLLKDDLINAEGDESFTYDIVAKPDKTLGIIPKKANNTVFIQSINVNKGSNSLRGKFYYTLHINIPIISSVPFTIQSVKLIGYGFDRNEIDVTDNTNLTYSQGNNSLYSINMRTIDYDIDFGTGGWLMGLEFMFSVGGTTETYFRFFERAII